MKINGAQLKAWYTADWGHKDAYVDDLAVKVNGEEAADSFEPEDVADTDAIEVEYGVVYLDGTGRKSKSVTAHIREWLKKQSHADLVVTVPVDRMEEFKALIKGFKGASIRRG